jgi:hypothetical protein
MHQKDHSDSSGAARDASRGFRRHQRRPAGRRRCPLIHSPSMTGVATASPAVAVAPPRPTPSYRTGGPVDPLKAASP